MKHVLWSLALTALTIPSFASAKCIREAREEAFRHYKDECGGIGGKRNCEIAQAKWEDGKGTIQIQCGFSGEPDYSDSGDFTFTYNSKCELENTVVNSCYTN